MSAASRCAASVGRPRPYLSGRPGCTGDSCKTQSSDQQPDAAQESPNK